MASASNNPSALLEEDSNAMMDTLPLAESTLLEGQMTPMPPNASASASISISMGGISSSIPDRSQPPAGQDHEEDEDDFPDEDEDEEEDEEEDDDEEEEDGVEDEEDSLLDDLDDESMTPMNVGDVTLGTDLEDSLMGGEDDDEEDDDDGEEDEEGEDAPEDVWKEQRLPNPALKAVLELTTDSTTNSGAQSPASSTPDANKDSGEIAPEEPKRKKRGRPSRAEMARRAKARELAGEPPPESGAGDGKKTRRRTNPKKVELDENGQPVVKRRGRKPMPPEVKARIKEEKRLQKIEERKQKRLKARRDRGEEVDSSSTGKKRQRGRRAKVLTEEELAERERIRKQKYEEFKQQKREKAQQRLERNAALREFRKKKKEEEKKQREEYEKRMQNLRASFLDENSHMSAGVGEESVLDESSMQSAGASKLPRWAMGNLELSQLKQIKQVSAETLFEYCWPPGGKISEYYFLQEQVTEYLGIKSFKRKYPHCLRRNVEAEERDFLVEMKIVNETQADLGLTAIPATQVLDIMSQDFYDKYDVYMTVKSERKDRMNRQTNYSTVTIEKHKFADFVEKAVQSASDWNKQLNQEKREKRRAYFDMQTFIIQRPMNNRGRMKVLPRPKLGNYPVALIPGQFVDYYKKLTPAQLSYLPLNTTLHGPPPAQMRLSDIGSDGKDSVAGSSDCDSSSSSDDSDSDSSSSSASSSEDEEEKLEGVNGEKKNVSEKEKTPVEDEKPDKPIDAEVPGATCKICTGDRVRNKIGQPEKLLHCSKCSQSCHPTCAGLTLELLEYVTKYKWMCTECKVCSLCQDHSDEEKMLFCDLCDRGYHTYCAGLDTIPSGRWQCGKCTVCSSCNVRDPPGTNVLQSEHRWVYEFKTSALSGNKVYSHAMCKPCHRSWKKGSFCPECTVVFGREPDKSQEEIEYYNCWVCARPHHNYCVGQATFICGFCQKKTLEKSLGSVARNASSRDFSEPTSQGTPNVASGSLDRSTSQSTSSGYSRRASLEYQPVTCDVCQKVYKNKSTLYSHKNRDHGVKSSIK